MSNINKKWKVVSVRTFIELEEVLNKLYDEGYTFHSLHTTQPIIVVFKYDSSR